MTSQLFKSPLGSPLSRGRVSRREFLKMMGAVAAVAGAQPLLSACGGGAPKAAPTEAKIGGTIDFLSWEGYDLLTETKAWREQHGV